MGRKVDRMMKKIVLLKKIMGTESGVSLVSVMIAAGILGIVTLFSIKVQEGMIGGAKSVERRHSVMGVFSNIRSFLANAEVCKESLAGLKPAESVPEIKDDKGNVVYQENNFYEDGNIQLQSMNLSALTESFSGSSRGFLDLNVVFSQGENRTGRQSLGFLPRRIRLYVEIDPNNDGVIKNCITVAGKNSGNWQYGSNESLYYMGNSVGVGTNSPGSKLDVQGNAKIEGQMGAHHVESKGAIQVGQTASTLACSGNNRGTQRYSVIGGEIVMQFCSENRWKAMKEIWEENGSFIFSPTDSIVGIGTNTPSSTERLEVKGDSWFQGFMAMSAPSGSSKALVVRGNVRIDDSSSDADTVLQDPSTSVRLGVNGNVKIEKSIKSVLWLKDGGANSITCDATKVGSVRSNVSELQYCNGTAWKTIQTKKLPTVDQIGSGLYHSCAKINDGIQTTAKCWGSNTWGQLGIGKFGQNIPVPTTVLESGTPESNPIPFKQIKELSLGDSHTCIIAGTNRKAYCWGNNHSYKLGIDGFEQRDADNKLTFKIHPTEIVKTIADDPFTDIDKISAGFYHTCAVKNQAAWCWGGNFYGQIGNGESGNDKFVKLPTKINTDGYVVDVAASESFTCALLANKKAQCWGANWYGQLGNDNDEYKGKGSPEHIYVEGITDIAQIAVGLRHACARLENGSMWCWGAGWSGQLGNGTFDSSSIPVQVETSPGVALLGVTHISASQYQTCAVLTGGKAMCWGLNKKGEVGNGLTEKTHTPALVSDIINVEKVSAGYNHTCAVSNEPVNGGNPLVKGSTVSCWGSNYKGQLGVGQDSSSHSLLPKATLLLLQD